MQPSNEVSTNSCVKVEAYEDPPLMKKLRRSPQVEEAFIEARALCDCGRVSFRAECAGHARTWSSALEAAAENDDEEESFTSYYYESTLPGDMFRDQLVSFRGAGSLGSARVFQFKLHLDTAITEAVVEMWGVYFEVDQATRRERQLEAQDAEIAHQRLSAEQLASDHRLRQCELRIRFRAPTTCFSLVAHDEAFCIRSRGRLKLTVVRASPKANDLADDLGTLFDEESSSDLTLSVKGRTFKVLRAILCARSSAMRAQLAAGLEARSPVITLPDIDPEPFALFLRWCYTGQLPNQTHPKPTDTTLLLGVLEIADRYLAGALVSLCVDKLISLVESAEPKGTVLQCLLLIYSNPGLDASPVVHKLRLLCLDIVSKHFSDVYHHDPCAFHDFVKAAPAAMVQIGLRLASSSAHLPNVDRPIPPAVLCSPPD